MFNAKCNTAKPQNVKEGNMLAEFSHFASYILLFCSSRLPQLHLQLIFVVSLSLFLMSCQNNSQESSAKQTPATDPSSIITTHDLYVGTYTQKEGHVDGKAQGIYQYKTNLELGTLTNRTVIDGIVNPSFLELSPDGTRLYAVSEIGAKDDTTGYVMAYAIQPQSKAVTPVSRQVTLGFAPCHISVDRARKWLFLTNYVGGKVLVYALTTDGFIGGIADTITLEGSGPHPEQEASHPHSAILSPDNRFVYVSDKGTDKVMIYQLDRQKGKLNPAEQPFVQVQAGAGPRHFTFHPQLPYAYLINELDATVNAFQYNSENGGLQEIQSISTLPESYDGFNACADIHISPDGKFLYGSNRGHDSIVIYRINQKNGQLTLVGHQPTQGEFPRNFALAPGGDFLFVANQNSDNIVIFRVNKDDGTLTPAHEAVCPTPVCLKFLTTRMKK